MVLMSEMPLCIWLVMQEDFSYRVKFIKSKELEHLKKDVTILKLAETS